MDIDAQLLRGSRDDYVRRVTESTERQDPLTKFLLEIADRAESRFGEQVGIREKVRELIAGDIVPNLRGRLFDLQRSRVETEIFWLRTVEVELSAGQLVGNSIPGNSRLRASEGAFSEIFGVSPPPTGEITWSDLHERMNRPGGSPALSTIGQIIISAMSGRLKTENITRTHNRRVFRAVVGHQISYFDGRTAFSVYFVPIESRSGNRDVSILLGIINMADKYKAILELQSPLSLESFRFQRDSAKAWDMVGELVSRLRSLEEESDSLGLNEVSAIQVYFGPASDSEKYPAALEEVIRSLLKQVTEAMCRVMVPRAASDTARTSSLPFNPLPKLTIFLSHAKQDGTVQPGDCEITFIVKRSWRRSMTKTILRSAQGLPESSSRASVHLTRLR